MGWFRRRMRLWSGGCTSPFPEKEKHADFRMEQTVYFRQNSCHDCSSVMETFKANTFCSLKKITFHAPVSGVGVGGVGWYGEGRVVDGLITFHK